MRLFNCSLRWLITGLLLLIEGRSLVAQPTYHTLSGRILSQDTKRPVPFASVGLFKRNLGTVTNAEGAFVLKIPSRYARDTLQISCLGYHPSVWPLSGMVQPELAVELVPTAITLSDVRVQGRALSGEELIRQAVAAIPTNYDTTSVQLTAFFREDVRLANYLIAYNEAVVAIHKAPYGKPQAQDSARIVKGRKRPVDHSALQIHGYLNHGNGVRSALSQDFVKLVTHKFNPLNPRNRTHYAFTVLGLTNEGGRSTYVIGIQPAKKGRQAYVVGKVFVDVQSMAFTRVEWEGTTAGVARENNRQLLARKVSALIAKISIKLTGFRQVVSFQPHQGKWYLISVEGHLDSSVNSPAKQINNQVWWADYSLTTTAIGPKNGPFPVEGDINQQWTSLSSLISDEDDPHFWKNYTVPSLALDTALVSSPFKDRIVQADTNATTSAPKPRFSNRANGFTRADTLRGKLSPLRSYDVTFYHLSVEPNLADQSIRGSTKIRFRVREPLPKMQVDLYANMRIQTILFQGKPLAYTRESDAVFIQLPYPLPAGTEQSIEVFYEGKPQVPDPAIPMHGGFFWKKDPAGNPWVQVVCQGSGASLWWPCKDHLSDEPDSMRISVTVPDTLMDISNGRLLHKTTLAGHRTRYDWQVSYPINTYNVTLNIGKYRHVRDTYSRSNPSDTLTLDYYFMPHHQAKSRWLINQVKPMLALLEKQYGPYPFPRDGFSLLESLYPMEHQSAVCFGPLADSDTDSLALMRLVWHEASHEWWGNSVSCGDMADFWLHEAFATYSEGLFWQQQYGPDGLSGYLSDLTEQVTGREPILGVYDVNHIHYDIGDLYAKGALLLHTFRQVLNNDRLWEDLLRGIQTRFKHQTISTNDLINYINTKTGQDYTYFFDQYLKYPTLPTLQLRLTPAGQSLTVKYRWKADVAQFRMPVRISTSRGQLGFIYPESSWKTITLASMQPEDFEVDEDRFYIAVDR